MLECCLRGSAYNCIVRRNKLGVAIRLLLDGANVPLYDNAEVLIRRNLTQIASGDRPNVIEIASLTENQFVTINIERVTEGLPAIEQNEIVFMGRHLYTSRSADGYNIDDMVKQIASALSEHSVPYISPKMTCLHNNNARDDGYGNLVEDRAVFEATARKPRMELFSVIPKGDTIKPIR